jgi:hypothetical protein
MCTRETHGGDLLCRRALTLKSQDLCSVGVCKRLKIQTTVFRKAKVVHHDRGELSRPTELKLNPFLPVALVDGSG